MAELLALSVQVTTSARKDSFAFKNGMCTGWTRQTDKKCFKGYDLQAFGLELGEDTLCQVTNDDISKV